MLNIKLLFDPFRDPNGPNLPVWPAYTPEEEQFLEMKSPKELIVNKALRKEYCKFWNRINKEFNTGIR